MHTAFRTMLALFSLLAVACNEQAQAQVQVRAQSSVSVDDFDLETVVGLLKTKKVGNAADLENIINGDSPISNVDVDKDGKRDRISVKETRSGAIRTLDFVAFPSGETNPAPITIASVNFKVDGAQLYVSGGYPDYVRGYDRAYYGYSIPYGPSFGDMLFYSWLFAPRPVYVYRPYVSVGYVARPVFAPATYTTLRTTYRTETRVSPVVRQAPPPTFKVNYASQPPSRYVSKPVATSSRLSDRSGSLSNFTVRDSGRARATGTAFGASAPSRPSSSSSSWSRPSSSSSSWSRPSSSSSSRSFGSGSSSRRR